MVETTVVYDTVTLVLRGIFEKGDRGDYFNAPEPRNFRIYEVICDKQNIMDILDCDVLLELEEKALERMEE